MVTSNSSPAKPIDRRIRLASETRDSIDEELLRLAREWENETAFSSSTTEQALHPAYQRIIGTGIRAVPFLLSRLKGENPGHWFWALKAITGEDPVSIEDRGNVRKMALAWLAWGGAHGYC